MANFFRMKNSLRKLLRNAVDICIDKGLVTVESVPPIEVDIPKDTAHGDYASNIAMVLASRVRGNFSPRKIAELLSAHIHDEGRLLERIEIAGPGFLNFFIREDVWAAMLRDVDREGELYGTLEM
ncbi:MAG: arginine--tRNA ligase, partial [Deltaproteobacteria bacterium]|nr:arginine--tRNA ligase [Deltaproteobacteria bacterium]